MGIAFHTQYAVDGLNGFQTLDRIYVGSVAVTYTSGSAGATVTATVTWTEPVPTPYRVFFDPPEQADAWATSRTALGFTLNVAPSTAALSLAGGSMGCVIFA
jgi:hypothetical protein